MANRGIARSLFRHGLRVPRLILDGSGGAVETPFHLTPQSPPTGTAVQGDAYFDNAVGQFLVYNGDQFISPSAVRVIKNGAATLAAGESGALCVFSTAAGYTYTLPAARSGLWFDFLVTTTITSVGAKVICASGDFIVGSYLQIPDTAAQIAAHAANGSTHVSWNGNGTTTGGYAGESFRLTAISASQWAISGIGLATGTEATPFATS